jgi:methylmalonyl-CoA/ethylmalonyl-CoA epimerase
METMLKDIDHIGIAVTDLEQIKETYRLAFNQEPDFEEEVSDQQVIIVGYQVGKPAVEFFSPTSPESSISVFLAKRGNAIHHIAYRVENLIQKLSELRASGYELIDEEPRQGADGKKIAFLHPKSFDGILIELCEY